MTKPVTLDSRYVRMFDSGAEPAVCHICLKKTALWMIGAGPQEYASCAYCFLTASPWGKSNSAEVMELAGRVGMHGVRVLSDDGGLLEEEADRVLYAIVATSSIKEARRAGLVRR